MCKLMLLLMTIILSSVLGLRVTNPEHFKTYDENKYVIRPSCCREHKGRICRSARQSVCCTGECIHGFIWTDICKGDNSKLITA